MSVEIDPQELGFHRPFTVEVSEVLRIKNPNSQPVAFKVKTTAPKQYCVRPNSGRIESGNEVEVAVILQAMKQEPAADAKCRDKFLVQSISISSDKDFANLASIWDGVEKSSVNEKKIKVVFLSPKGSGAANLSTPNKPSAVNGNDATPDVPPPAYSSPGDFTASQADTRSPAQEVKIEQPSPNVGVGTSAAPRNSVPTIEEPKQQVTQAEKSPVQPKQEQGALRQRKVGAADQKPTSKPAELAQQVRSGTEGVPVQYVAALCLMSFLLAYFFF